MSIVPVDEISDEKTPVDAEQPTQASKHGSQSEGNNTDNYSSEEHTTSKTDNSMPPFAENNDSKANEDICSCSNRSIVRLEGDRLRCFHCALFVDHVRVILPKTCAGNDKATSEPTGTIRKEILKAEIKFPWGDHYVFTNRLVIGRASHPDKEVSSLPEEIRDRLQSQYPTVSRFHALVSVCKENEVTVEPLEALNGLFVNGTQMVAGKSENVTLPCTISLGKKCDIEIQINAESAIYEGEKNE